MESTNGTTTWARRDDAVDPGVHARPDEPGDHDFEGDETEPPPPPEPPPDFPGGDDDDLPAPTRKG